ncbi:MAG: hypothetical protein ACLFSW_01745 [Halobacteriales archaeon]
MSEVEEIDEADGFEGEPEDSGGFEDEDRYLVVEYEEDPIENYDTRLLLIGLGLSFLFGLGVGIAAFLTQGGL